MQSLGCLRNLCAAARPESIYVWVAAVDSGAVMLDLIGVVKTAILRSRDCVIWAICGQARFGDSKTKLMRCPMLLLIGVVI